MLGILLPLLAISDQAVEIRNPSFDEGLTSWERAGEDFDAVDAQRGGRTAARLEVGAAAEVGWPGLEQEIDAPRGAMLEGSARIAAESVRAGYGAYIAVDFLNAQGERISYGQSWPVTGDAGWTPVEFRAVVPEDTAQARVKLLLNGRGTAYFDDVAIRSLGSIEAKPIEGPVRVTVTEEVACPALQGFGAEDDGWFYNDENAAQGADAAAYALKEERVEWLDPDWTRMFFWHLDWNPSADLETFDFNTVNMRSHYRTLELYQRIGSQVNVVGVEWATPGLFQHPPEKLINAVGELMEHLIKDKGFTCITYWTLSNEPNGAYMSHAGTGWDQFVKLHRLAVEEFEERGLDVQVVGSDDAQSIQWFRRCVSDPAYYELSDIFASHRYFYDPDRMLIPHYLNDRISMLEEREPEKPFVVGEFGFQDERSTHLLNPIMAEYRYAIWTVDFVAQALNRGAAGMSIWTMHEVYYPGNGFMEYGLWEWANEDWRVRPVYHAFGMFPRLTERGDASYVCESSHPQSFRAARVEDTVFWVNSNDEPLEVEFRGVEAAEARVMTQDNIEGDRETGELVPLEANTLLAPARSFGYIRLAP